MKIDLEQLKILSSKGLSQCQIAKILNCSQPGVRYWYKQLGIKACFSPVGGPSAHQISNKLVLRLYKQHKSTEEIASEIGRSYKSVSSVIGRYLMDLCRKEPKCPMKALLPESEIE